jgi:hypothetical protein
MMSIHAFIIASLHQFAKKQGARQTQSMVAAGVVVILCVLLLCCCTNIINNKKGEIKSTREQQAKKKHLRLYCLGLVSVHAVGEGDRSPRASHGGASGGCGSGGEAHDRRRHPLFASYGWHQDREEDWHTVEWPVDEDG